MKILSTLLLCFAFACAAFSQTNDNTQPPSNASVSAETTPNAPQAPAPTPETTSKDNRLFFPTGWIYGWGQFDLAPPHNEPDPGLCAPNAGQPQYGGVNAPCNKFARYLLSGNFVVHPFGKTILHVIKFEYNPTMAFGKNLPHTLYTWDWNWIGMENSWVAAVDLPKRFDIRMTQHFLWTPQYTNLGSAYIGGNGPWGRYLTFGVRKSFGTYRDYNGPTPIK
jgi:hypothetical protein